MKRIISLVLALMLALSLLPAVSAGSAPAVSSNIDDHFYINVQRWTDPIRSTLAYEDGGFLRVECIDDALVVERYDADHRFLSGRELPLELPVYGGVYLCDDYNFVMVGQTNYEEDDTKEVFRIIRYTKDWQKVDHASIYGANTTVPFDAGCVRFDRSGDILYIRTSHEMYTSSDGYNHQANVMLALRISDMTVTDQFTHVLNKNYGYVSHSFNQFVRVDGDKLLAVDHGDAHPRSVALFRYGKPAGSETFYGSTTMVNALPIVDSTYHYNDTGVSVGGFEFSSTDYLIAGCSYDQTASTDLRYVQRNIFVTATPKDDFTDEGTTVHWLTSFTEGVTVSPPHLLKLDADRFFLTWTEDGVLKYCFLDGRGALDGEIVTGSGDLSDCEPILADETIVWYVTDGSAPVFHEIELNPHVHDYQPRVTQPTCTTGGYTTYTCAECGDSYVSDHTSALGHSYGAWYTTQEPTCTAAGSQRRDCVRCGSFETNPLAALGHDYETTITQPTCTEQGYTTRTCTHCGDSHAGDYVPALGHDWDEGVVITEPTEETHGLRRHTCIRCAATEDRIIPALSHTHSYETAVTAPTCTAQGFTTHTCACGDSYIDSYTAALGHDWKYLACTRCGALRENPFTDTEPGSFYFDPVLWALEKGITTGATATTFDPMGQCQRAQVVTFLWRSAGMPEPTSGSNPFVDVSENDFYYKAVLWAVEKGITNGLDADHFGPYTDCNRAQVVTFLWRAMGRPETQDARNPFTDVEAGAFYEKAVLWAVEEQITNGLSSTEFGVNAICNRAQIVTFLYRTFA